MWIASLAVLLVLHLAAAPSARATTAEEICPGLPAPCVVRTTFPVTAGSTLDFGTSALTFEQGGKLELASSGLMLIKAGDVSLERGSALDGREGGIIILESSGTVRIDRGSSPSVNVSGNPTGSVDITAVGDVHVLGDIDAHSTDSEASGGDVTLVSAAGKVDARGLIDLHGGSLADGGSLVIEGFGGVTVAGTIDAKAGELGGAVEIDTTGIDIVPATGGGVTIEETAKLFLQAERGGGIGGNVTILAAADAVLGGEMELRGETSGEDEGDTGDVEVTSENGSIRIRGTIDLEGPRAGFAGEAVFSAAVDIVQEASIPAQVRGVQSQGGILTFEAEHDLTLRSIDASSDGGFGGSVDATAWCALSVLPGQTVDVSGTSGSNALASGGAMTVSGTLRAVGGTNELRFLSAPPVVAPGALIPDAPPIHDPFLIPCGGLPPPGCGNGTVDPPGETCDGSGLGSCPTGTTGCSPVCQCQVCGNGRVDPGETCDDANTDPCAGSCAADCSRRADECGDGVTECGEESDDGNRIPCDGVSDSCHVEVCGNGVPECAEECDDGPTSSTRCSPQCRLMTPPGCGDGTVAGDEACDDGNLVDCDGCSRFCGTDGCGNGTRDASCGEACDDFNRRPGDGCSAACQPEVCGDGKVDVGEQCDDANQNECDGCTGDCSVPARPCPACTAATTDPCVPCTRTVECDPLQACGSSVCSNGTCTPTNPPNCSDGDACTTDTCDPARGCVNAPVTCPDATACDGTQSCNPATGQCVTGPAADCDDRDECTDDSCTESAPSFRCVNQLRPGLDGASCRLSGLQRLIDSADIPKKTQKKLRTLTKKVGKKLPAAAGTGRKATNALKQVNSGLKALTHTVAKAQRKIPAATLGELNSAIESTSVAVGNL